jgi:uncharacterized protein
VDRSKHILAAGQIAAETESKNQALCGEVSRRDVLRALNAGWLAAGSGLLAMPWVSSSVSAAAAVTGPYQWREIENTWIPMSDGTRLAARIWLPRDTPPVPAILNYNPYYGRMLERLEEDARFPFFASHGYAGIHVDIRGSGNSEGRPQDEYVQQEQDDGVEIIAWIARQTWCDGKVGMEGYSWDGCNSLQVAARRPPALRAIITHCSADNRYTDDAHYKGGCVLHDMFEWANLFLACQAQAPDPAIVGREGWREKWRTRLDAVPFNVATWMSHPHWDGFWKHGSVSKDYGQIACPVYAVGGWVDAYKNTVFRLMEHLRVPRKGLVGPWTHGYPQAGAPGPAIGFLSEALRWWDHWLKGQDTGIMQEPMLRVWMQDKVPAPDMPVIPGRWVAEATWPSGRIADRNYYFSARNQLNMIRSPEQRCELDPLQTVGQSSGNWCPSGGGEIADLAIEMALDQRPDDARSLVFDSEPLTEALEFLGAPVLSLDLAVDQPVAAIAVRLNDVLPTGESGRVTYGLLNLCQRDSSESPSPLIPGTRYSVRVSLDYAAHRFQPGSIIRVSISTAYWPMMLPSPAAVRLSVWTGASSIALPVRPPRPEDVALRPFAPPYQSPVSSEEISSTSGTRLVEWDVRNQRQTIETLVDDEIWLLKAINTRMRTRNDMKCEILDSDPNGASIEYRFVLGWERDELKPSVIATHKVVTTPTDFLLSGQLTALDGEEQVFERKWTQKVPRHLV